MNKCSNGASVLETATNGLFLDGRKRRCSGPFAGWESGQALRSCFKGAEFTYEPATLALTLVIYGKPNLMVRALDTAAATANRRDTLTLPEIANPAILDPQGHFDGLAQ